MPRLGAIDLLAVPPRVVHANCYAFRASEELGPHYDEDVLLTLVDDGRGRIDVDGRPFALERGDVLYAPWAARLRYLADARKPMAITSVHLVFMPWPTPSPATRAPTRGARLPQLARPGQQPWDAPFLARDRGALRELGRRIVVAWDAAPRRDVALRGLALELIDELTSARPLEAAPEAPAHPLAATVHAVASWMETNFSRPIRRSELVARSGLDATTLTAAFHAVLGRPPIDWLIEARLREARALLRTTRAPVGEVGWRVGIRDPYYFSKLFRRRVGVSPKRYRAGVG